MTTSNQPRAVDNVIAEVSGGNIIVIDKGGRTDYIVWDHIMMQHTVIRKIVVTANDVVLCDEIHSRQDNYPLFTRGRFMQTGNGRVQIEAVNVPGRRNRTS